MITDELRLGPVAVDANALDRDGTARDALVDRFRRKVEAGDLTVMVAGGVRDELSHPQTPPELRELALARPAPPRPALTHAQKLDRIRVRAILRGDAPCGKHEADALHLSEAAEAGCAVFITHDRRILRRRADLRAVLPRSRHPDAREIHGAPQEEDADEEDRHGAEDFF